MGRYDYVKVATITLDDERLSGIIASALVNAGYTVAFSLDYREIYILEDSDYDSK